MYHSINWLRIGQAFEYYKTKGYQPVEVPWIVDDAVSAITFPAVDETNSFLLKGSETGLVASAEQGFLQIADTLSLGKYVSCSPCFRREGGKTEFHQDTFMKIELFEKIDTNCSMRQQKHLNLYKTIKTVTEFLGDKAELVCLDEYSYDLNINGIEVGSYGIRQHQDTRWVYGTGLAEPRYSMAVASDARS
jgi:hypothetical protein